tara:strand:+ start:2535 stop:3326 length:792 start_codon:yes stop_codon:yes gene_type:complete
MAIQSSEAIILKRIPLGDTSLLVTVYSRNFGKVKLVARGARGPKSKIASALQPFCIVTVIFNQRPNRELQNLSKIEVGSFFRNIGEDLSKVGYASAVCELVDRLVLGEEPGHELFNLMFETLQAIDLGPSEACEVLFWRFQLEFAYIYGAGPEFSNCRGCTKPLQDKEVNFSLAEGGVLCRACQGQDSNTMRLSLGTIRFLSRVCEMPRDRLNRLKPLKASRAEIKRLIKAYYLYQMDDRYDLKSLKFLESIEIDVVEKNNGK